MLGIQKIGEQDRRSEEGKTDRNTQKNYKQKTGGGNLRRAIVGNPTENGRALKIKTKDGRRKFQTYSVMKLDGKWMYGRVELDLGYEGESQLLRTKLVKLS